MPRTLLDVPLPAGFHFSHTVYSHGWCALAPFSLARDPLTLERPIRCRSGNVVAVRADALGRTGAVFHVTSPRALSARDRTDATNAAAAIFNTGLDLDPFHRAARGDPRIAWMSQRKAGRFLRGATFFEDVVKMILTTNCTWSLTEAMTTTLVERLGSGPGGSRCFPLPEAIADCSEEELRRDVRLGYRAPYVLELARKTAAGYPVEEFRTSSAPSAEVYRELRTIKGVGDYAAGNLLKLIGRFDRLGLDSWCRTRFAVLHNNGTTATDPEIERFYERYDEWRGLVMWLDVTRDWYFDKFPI